MAVTTCKEKRLYILPMPSEVKSVIKKGEYEVEDIQE